MVKKGEKGRMTEAVEVQKSGNLRRVREVKRGAIKLSRVISKQTLDRNQSTIQAFLMANHIVILGSAVFSAEAIKHHVLVLEDRR